MSLKVRAAGAWAATVGVVAALGVLSSTGSHSYLTFGDTYQGLNAGTGTTCATTYSIYGREPQTGTHPVLIWLTGTGGDFDGREGQKIVTEAAKRGFVSGSVQYDDTADHQTATGLVNNANCMFASNSSSATGELCARPRADCSKGIVVMGHSQGSAVGARGKNADSRVRAGAFYGFALGDEATMDASPSGDRALPNDRIRIVNAEGEVEFFGTLVAEMNSRTGESCSSADGLINCLNGDGSGWYVVGHTQVVDGNATHCYFHGAGGADCSLDPPFDANWLNPATTPWGLNSDLTWLDSFTEE